jgi:hypothetical protein
LKTIIKGDSVVILKVEQADEINVIFERQKKQIQDLKDTIVGLKKNVITRDSVIFYMTEIQQEKEDFDSSIAQRLDLIENWLYYSSIEGSWLYYSYQDSLIYRVDLSNYKVRKDNNTGDLYFYWCEDYDKDNMVDEFINLRESPILNWQKEVRRSRRPKVEVVPIKQ